MSLIHLEVLDDKRKDYFQRLAVKKALIVSRGRGTWRDYVDIFFLLKNYITISDVIKFAEKKFEQEFNDRLFLEQLVYFDDLGEFKISFIDKKYSEESIKNYFVRQVKKYQKSIIK